MGRHALDAPYLPPTRGVRNARIEVQMIAAVDGHGVIGNDGRVPWHCPADLKRFRAITANQPVIVGRKTWEDIVKRAKGPTILPTRTPIIITGNAGYATSQLTAPDGEAALRLADLHGNGQAMVIGGASIYEMFAPIASTVHLTRVPGCHTGDTFFSWSWVRGFRCTDWEVTDGEAVEFMTLTRPGW